MNPLIPLDYLLLLTVPLLLGVTIVSWLSAREVSRPRRAAMAGVRLLGAAGVLALLFNPGRWREPVEETGSGWAVMLDRSASMATAGAGSSGSRPRWEEASELTRRALAASVRPDFVRLYAFSEKAEPVAPGALAGLVPDGPRTRLTGAGQELLARERGRGGALRGILLLSDGRQPERTPAEPFALRAAARQAPVYPVVLGGEVLAGDLEVKSPRRRYVSFLGQPVTLQAVLENRRLGPVQAAVKLCDAAGVSLFEKTLFVTNGQALPVSFEIDPGKPGYYEYTLETPPRDGEADRANNAVSLGVFVLTEKLNVLMLEGEPYWDTKFLSHLLRGQTNMSVTAVFRVAKDRLFRVSSESELAAATEDAFPSTDEALAAYDLVVIGRGSEYMIDETRARLLDRFVREQGGCLFFARGKSYNGPTSPLAFLEPVEWGREAGVPHSLKPLLAGEYAGLFGGLLPERESPVWESLPPLERGVRCESLKSFASVLADAAPQGGDPKPFPGLVSRRHGKGLVLLVNGDGLWKWGFFPRVAEPQGVYRNLWIRLFQWAVSFAEYNPGSDFAIRCDRGTARVREPVKVQVTAKPHAGAAAPAVRIYRGAALVRELPLAAAGEGLAGAWFGLASLEEPGIYRLSVETAAGPAAGAQATLQILPPPGEADERSADPAFLAELAALSGGRVVAADAVPELVRELEAPRPTSRQGKPEWDPAWDTARAGLLLAGCFGLEWFWRRKRGLL